MRCVLLSFLGAIKRRDGRPISSTNVTRTACANLVHASNRADRDREPRARDSFVFLWSVLNGDSGHRLRPHGVVGY